MQHYNKNQKCCATCANWSGARRVIGTGTTKQVEVSSSNDHAKCYDNSHVGGFVDGPSACWGSSCSNYQLFPGLK